MTRRQARSPAADGRSTEGSPRLLRRRLLLVVVAAVIPALVLMILSSIDAYRREGASTRAEALRLAELSGTTIDRAIDSATQLLFSLTAIDAVERGTGEECNRILRGVSRRAERFSNVAVTDRAGRITCSAEGASDAATVAERDWFKALVRTGAGVVGSYAREAVTGRPALEVGYPVAGVRGSVRGAVYAAIDLDWLGGLAIEAGLPRGAAFTVVDEHGTILARHPNPQLWVGKHLPEAPLVGAVVDPNQPRGTVDTIGVDGVRRLYGFTLVGGKDTGVYVTVGIEAASAYAPVVDAAVRNLIGLLSIALLTAAAAWLLGSWLVVEPAAAAVQHERASAERERLAADELRELDAWKNDFIVAVAHDLRSPLTGMIGSASLLESQFERLTPEEVAEFTSEIGTSSRRLEAMLSGLLDVDRLSRGRVAPERVTIDLEEFLTGVVREEQSAEHPVVVRADRVRVAIAPEIAARIVGNLISNARKHTPAGTPIHVSASARDETVTLVVEDEGPGVADVDKQRIFEIFKRGATESPGAGLGLYLVARFADLHGGRAWVEDRIGGGARFVVTLSTAGPDPSPRLATS